MLRKAERFRRRVERTDPPRPKQPRKPRRDWPVDTAEPGVSATDRKATPLTRANPSIRAGEKASFALEVQAERPTRKSTRASQNRVKNDANLTLRAAGRARSPRARAAKAQVRHPS